MVLSLIPKHSASLGGVCMGSTWVIYLPTTVTQGDMHIRLNADLTFHIDVRLSDSNLSVLSIGS